MSLLRLLIHSGPASVSVLKSSRGGGRTIDKPPLSSAALQGSPDRAPASPWEDEHMTGYITRRAALALGANVGALGFSGLPAFAQQRFFHLPAVRQFGTRTDRRKCRPHQDPARTQFGLRNLLGGHLSGTHIFQDGPHDDALLSHPASTRGRRFARSLSAKSTKVHEGSLRLIPSCTFVPLVADAFKSCV